ncbi:unnamed protein product, partial [Rotaria magnacalcarata]
MHLKSFESLPRRKLITLDSQAQTIKVVYIYNPTDQRRIQIVKILVSTHQVFVTSNNQPID